MNPGIMENSIKPLVVFVPRTSTGALAEKAKVSRVIIRLREFSNLAPYVRYKGCPKPLRRVLGRSNKEDTTVY